MGESLSRSTVRAFFEAYTARDAAKVAPMLADDVEWTMTGPVGVFPFCGVRRGREAVLHSMFRVKPGILDVVRTDVEHILIDGDNAAAYSRITALDAKSGRKLTYHCGHFAVFRDGRLVSFEAVTDTFGIAEQVIGHRIDAYRMPELTADGDLVLL